MPDVPLDKLIMLYEEERDDTIPITYVALWSGKPVGSATLERDGGIRPDCLYKNLSPDDAAKIGWVGDLVVDAHFQNKGIGKALIARLMKEARALDFDALCLFTFDENVVPYYKKLGWKTFWRDIFLARDVSIMHRKI